MDPNKCVRIDTQPQFRTKGDMLPCQQSLDLSMGIPPQTHPTLPSKYEKELKFVKSLDKAMSMLVPISINGKSQSFLFAL